MTTLKLKRPMSSRFPTAITALMHNASRADRIRRMLDLPEGRVTVVRGMGGRALVPAVVRGRRG